MVENLLGGNLLGRIPHESAHTMIIIMKTNFIFLNINNLYFKPTVAMALTMEEVQGKYEIFFFTLIRIFYI